MVVGDEITSDHSIRDIKGMGRLPTQTSKQARLSFSDTSQLLDIAWTKECADLVPNQCCYRNDDRGIPGISKEKGLVKENHRKTKSSTF